MSLFNSDVEYPFTHEPCVRPDPAEPIDLFFSQQSADQIGRIYVYRTLEGVEVEATLVRDPGVWSDSVKVGQTAGDLSGFVRSSGRSSALGWMR
jgi:hypothetical protein